MKRDAGVVVLAAVLVAPGCAFIRAAPPPAPVSSEVAGLSPSPRTVTATEPAPGADKPALPGTRPTAATSQPTKMLFEERFSGGPPSPQQWVLRNPGGQQVLVEEGALVVRVRSETRSRGTKVELSILHPLPADGRWTLQFDALINSLSGGGRGEIRVELRDFTSRDAPQGSDFVLAERHWNEASGLKFGIFHRGAFVGWHEVAPVGQLGAWHHYCVDYDEGLLTLWRDGERLLDCDVLALVDQPLPDGLAIEMGFHVPPGSGIEGCLDNVVIVPGDLEAAPSE